MAAFRGRAIEMTQETISQRRSARGRDGSAPGLLRALRPQPEVLDEEIASSHGFALYGTGSWNRAGVEYRRHPGGCGRVDRCPEPGPGHVMYVRVVNQTPWTLVSETPVASMGRARSSPERHAPQLVGASCMAPSS